MEPRYDLLNHSPATLLEVIGDYLTGENIADPRLIKTTDFRLANRAQIGRVFVIENLDEYMGYIFAHESLRLMATAPEIEISALFPPICRLLTCMEVLKTLNGDDTPCLALAALLTLHIADAPV